MQRLPHRRLEPLTPGLRAQPAAPQQHGGRRPLHERQQVFVAAAERRHHLARARKRKDAPLRQVAVCGARAIGGAERCQDSGVHRVAQTVAPDRVAEHVGLRRLSGNLEHASGSRRPIARCGVITAELPGGRPDSHDRHLSRGQRPGLVGADDGGGAQGLDGGQAAHERMPSRHAAHADRQRDGGHGRQCLRHRGDGQGDAALQDG